jgi:hypothetical protein
MRVGLIQSNYIPWRGYFDFIDDVDLFIFHDDLQYTKRDWRNRNLIKTPKNNTQWLTVPVNLKSPYQLIKDVSIDYTQKWVQYQINRFNECYKTTPFCSDAIEFLEQIQQKNINSISELNRFLISEICPYLNITTPLEVSWKYSPQGTKTERIIDIMKKIGATTFLEGPRGDCYIDKSLFKKNNICLEYKSYMYHPYPQPWGDFIGGVTILDLIANCGPNSYKFLKSTERNTIIIPSG